MVRWTGASRDSSRQASQRVRGFITCLRPCCRLLRTLAQVLLRGELVATPVPVRRVFRLGGLGLARLLMMLGRMVLLRWSRGSRAGLCLLMMAVILPATATAATASSPLGLWQMREGQRHFTLVVGENGGELIGTILDGETTTVASMLEWTASSGVLRFRAERADGWRWYKGVATAGVFSGRMAETAVLAGMPSELAYSRHVTGWNETVLDNDIVPRTYDMVVNGGFLARLRIDRDPVAPGRYIGQFKVYANTDPNVMATCQQQTQYSQFYVRWSNDVAGLYGAECEELEYDVDVSHWNGETLAFARQAGAFRQDFQGVVSGTSISGTFTQDGVAGTMPWSGHRAQVLGAGLTPPDQGLAVWQARTRAQVERLMMAGDPLPLVTTVTVLQDDMAPLAPGGMVASRDDDPAAWPQNYRLRELEFDYSLPGVDGGEPLHRISHGYLAIPDSAGPHPVALILNGHGGSAWSTMAPFSGYWYGDAFARRGYLTLAIDVSHRSGGDDPAHGNVAHPAIAAPGMDSDWEQDGERTWDAMRALDYLLSQPDALSGWVVVAGLSMGGEIAAQVAALDTRVSTAVVAGYTPDFNVLAWKDNHDCWQWQHAEIRDYVEMSDFLALIAPRQLIALTGLQDGVFSWREPPFSADKQVLRRARMATAAVDWQPIHYVHDGGHEFRVGDRNVAGQGPEYVRVPTQVAPAYAGDMAWQSNADATSLGKTLFELIQDHDILFADGFEASVPP